MNNSLIKDIFKTKHETLSEENSRLRKELWVLRVFVVLVVIILIYNLIAK